MFNIRIRNYNWICQEKIEFCLDKILLSNDNIIKLLVERVEILQNSLNEQKEKNKVLENEIKKLNEQNEKNDSEIKKFNEFLAKYENDFKELLEIKKNKSSLNINTKIIKTKDELSLITNRLRNVEKFLVNKSPKFKLLYRASEDGDSVSTFHSKCDNATMTLSIIRSKLGMRFGGFTTQTWKDNSGNAIWKKDDKAFCFSLELNKIYNIINGKDAIWCGSSYACYFARNIFGLYNGFFSRGNQGGWAYDMSQSNYSGQNNNYEIANENGNLTIDEVEVFEVSFE